MSTLWIVILFAAGLIAFFVVGMSLTLIFKGHHIKSEISDNENLTSRGLKCAVQEAREQEGLSGECGGAEGCAAGNCSTCTEYAE